VGQGARPWGKGFLGARTSPASTSFQNGQGGDVHCVLDRGIAFSAAFPFQPTLPRIGGIVCSRIIASDPRKHRSRDFFLRQIGAGVAPEQRQHIFPRQSHRQQPSRLADDTAGELAEILARVTIRRQRCGSGRHRDPRAMYRTIIARNRSAAAVFDLGELRGLNPCPLAESAVIETVTKRVKWLDASSPPGFDRAATSVRSHAQLFSGQKPVLRRPVFRQRMTQVGICQHRHAPSRLNSRFCIFDAAGFWYRSDTG